MGGGLPVWGRADAGAGAGMGMAVGRLPGVGRLSGPFWPQPATPVNTTAETSNPARQRRCLATKLGFDFQGI